jgi:hypothetical protein
LYTRGSDGDGDEFHSPPVFCESRNEGGVLLGLLFVFLFTSEVSGESNLYENEGAYLIFVEASQAGVGCVWDASGIYEVLLCAVASLEESFVSSTGSNRGGIRLGAAVHSASYS